MDRGAIDPQGLKRRTWLLGAAIVSIGLQGIAMYFLSADPLFLLLGLLFVMDLPLTVIGRAEKRNTFSVVANWLIAFGGSVCFLTVRTIWFVVALLCNLVLLAVCIVILYKPWISWKQRQKQRKRELRIARRMAGRKSNNEMIDRKKVL
jgi:hypothetical protein